MLKRSVIRQTDLPPGEYGLILNHAVYLSTGEVELWFTAPPTETKGWVVIRFKPSSVEVREVET